MQGVEQSEAQALAVARALDDIAEAEDLAARLGTINYEIVCGIGKRVPRVYLGG